MMIEYRIWIEGEPHRVRVEASTARDEVGTGALREFAVAAALMEHFGYLPRGVINAADSPLSSSAAAPTSAAPGRP